MEIDSPDPGRPGAGALPDSRRVRKLRSHRVLQERGVPINPHLPVLDDRDALAMRSRDDIVDRALCLGCVALTGEGLSRARVRQYIERYRLYDKLSPGELAFLRTLDPDEHARIQASWRYEGLWVMLWALDQVPELDYPDTCCDPAQAIGLIASHTEASFRSQADRRSDDEILAMADLTYRYHWACTDAHVNARPAPADLVPGVVYERHYAFSWLTGYLGRAWDMVSTDT